MIRSVFFMGVFAFLLGCAQSPTATDATKNAEGAAVYGQPITMKNPVTLANAIQQVGDKEKSVILVEGQVEKVCKKKGCWMALKSPSGDLRVTFHDYSFFVPQKLVGKTVIVQGEISQKKLSLKETKHYIEDEGGDPSQVTQPRTEYRIVATGVQEKS